MFLLLALPVLASASLRAGGDARALIVDVGGGNYDVKTITGTCNGLLTTLSAQSWFDGPGLAGLGRAFADTVFGGLGAPNVGDTGPLFATGLDVPSTLLEYLSRFKLRFNPSLLWAGWCWFCL